MVTFYTDMEYLHGTLTPPDETSLSQMYCVFRSFLFEQLLVFLDQVCYFQA